MNSRLSLAAAMVSALLAVAAIPAAVDAGTVPPPDDTTEPAPPAGDLPDEEGGIVNSWALTPARSDGGGGRTALSYSAAPGTQIEDAVTLFNLGNVDLEFRVYGTDAFNDSSGGFALLEGSETPTDVGSWVELLVEDIVVPAGQQATIPFTLTVPAGASAGDHAGAILASSPIQGRTDEGATVQIDRRTGSRLFVRVDGPLEPELTIEELQTNHDGSVNPLGGSANVTYRVTNRGNVRLTGRTRATVEGPFGVGREAAEYIQFDDFLPGQSFDVSADFDGVPSLFALRTKAELDQVRQANGGEVEPVESSQTSFAPPTTVLVLLVLLIGGLLGRRALRRRRNGEASPPQDTDDADVPELQPT